MLAAAQHSTPDEPFHPAVVEDRLFIVPAGVSSADVIDDRALYFHRIDGAAVAINRLSLPVRSSSV